MKQGDKELLLKDLCSRLPYKPIVQIDDCGIWNLRGIDHDDSAELRDRVIVWHGENYPSSKNSFPIINCKPFLFPLSSMTEEQLYNNPIGFSQMLIIKADRDWENITINRRAYYKLIDWFNKNHFDYRGLIPIGLAIDATGLGVY